MYILKSQMLRHTLIIPVFGIWRQEDQESKAGLNYIMSLRLWLKAQTKRMYFIFEG